MLTWTPQLLTTAIVRIHNKANSGNFRVLLDTGATANFISETVVKQLKLFVNKQAIPVGTINNMGTVAKGITNITIHSIYGDFEKHLTCIVVPIITEMIPSEIITRELIKIPANIRLADIKYYKPKTIDLLIGSGASLLLFMLGQIKLTNNEKDLYLQKTKLGWVIGGSVPMKNQVQHTYHCTVLEQTLVKFWETEEVINHRSLPSSISDCEIHFLKNIRRGGDGRYCVRLPFREEMPTIGDSRTNAFKRLLSLERRLNTNTHLKNEYERVFEEYINLNHMSMIDNNDDEGYYLPHHAIIKESSDTTKVRVVFDASAKTDRGLSLNDVLLTGPTIQDKLFFHLLRFRTYNYVLSADIEKMYRQVWVDEKDRRYQKVLWRIGDQIRTFQLNTLTFGIASSPFLAICTIHKLAEDEIEYFPNAAKVLKNNLYVDDLLAGSETIEGARNLRDEIIELLKTGGFNIRQWASNDRQIIDGLSSEVICKDLSKNFDQTLKTLGVT
ncbi:uncharacterized protein [Prorops nasuta]|uniref:uncharacterized protein n=1 Tax=Prorops nasuta TaxID=863751 RepID=UPI0034CEED7B